MPRTLDNTERIMAELGSAGLRPVTLLVVPGSGWDSRSLERLHGLVSAGAELAGHGWSHVAEHIRGLRHRLHSALISRDVAEHLALSRDEAVILMSRCHDWFITNGLPGPTLYVPPAWAMGRVRRSDLDELPFDQFETLGGVYDTRSRQFRRTPMIGFEADTAFRAASCRAWNWLNLRFAGESNPVRVAIHPQDLELLLERDLRNVINQGGLALSYRQLN